MNTKKKTLSVLTMAATALLFAACDKDEVGGPGDSHISQEVLAAFNARSWEKVFQVEAPVSAESPLPSSSQSRES